MDYRTALAKTYRLAAKGMVLGLDRVRAAAAILGDPQLGPPSVQIAGTNGKGAVAYLVERTASVAGLRTGLFTSPHLHRFTERIRIDGREADEGSLAGALAEVLALTEPPSRIPLTFFEVAALAAFLLFERAGVELAVLEVGLGGRLDATSIAAPIACAVTSVGLDHTAILGGTAALIAREKGAIARPGAPMITGSMPEEALAEIERICALRGSPLLAGGRDFTPDPALAPPWPGAHQRWNAAVALALVEILGRALDPRMTRSAFASALPGAAWPGRFETISVAGRHILDGAHNTEAMAALMDALEERRERPEAVLFGALAGKPIDEMLGILSGLGARIVMAPPPVDRAADHRELARRWGADLAGSVGEALALLSDTPGTVLVTGSLFTVGEARRLLLGARADPPVGL